MPLYLQHTLCFIQTTARTEIIIYVSLQCFQIKNMFLSFLGNWPISAVTLHQHRRQKGWSGHHLKCPWEEVCIIATQLPSETSASFYYGQMNVNTTGTLICVTHLLHNVEGKRQSQCVFIQIKKCNISLQALVLHCILAFYQKHLVPNVTTWLCSLGTVPNRCARLRNASRFQRFVRVNTGTMSIRGIISSHQHHVWTSGG